MEPPTPTPPSGVQPSASRRRPARPAACVVGGSGGRRRSAAGVQGAPARGGEAGSGAGPAAEPCRRSLLEQHCPTAEPGGAACCQAETAHGCPLLAGAPAPARRHPACRYRSERRWYAAERGPGEGSAGRRARGPGAIRGALPLGWRGNREQRDRKRKQGREGGSQNASSANAPPSPPSHPAPFPRVQTTVRILVSSHRCAPPLDGCAQTPLSRHSLAHASPAPPRYPAWPIATVRRAPLHSRRAHARHPPFSR